MKELNGMHVTFDFNKLRKIADLIVCDGPLLSHYATETGDQYLFYWLDADDECNRWMLVRTNLEALRRYIHGQTTLYNILTRPEDEFVWIADLDNDHKTLLVQTLPIDIVPEEYLPEKDSLYVFENNDPLLSGELDTYQLDLPERDSSFFKELIKKMGWNANSLKLSKRIAVL